MRRLFRGLYRDIYVADWRLRVVMICSFLETIQSPGTILSCQQILLQFNALSIRHANIIFIGFAGREIMLKTREFYDLGKPLVCGLKKKSYFKQSVKFNSTTTYTYTPLITITEKKIIRQGIMHDDTVVGK